MAKVTVEGKGTFEVADGTRLVLALTDVCGVDQLHACGGKAKCTTCRVRIISADNNDMTAAEKAVRAAKGIEDPTIRLSCQMLCTGNIHLEAISRFEGSGRVDAGKRPADDIEPPAEWTGA